MEGPAERWVRRNLWTCVAPLGCVAIVVAVVLFLGAILTLVWGMIRSSEPYQHAIARAQSDPVVLEALGSPVEVGLFIMGNFESSDSSGSADFSVPIQGPRAKGRLYVVASKSAGEWSISRLVLEVDDGRRLVLGPVSEREAEGGA
ncbi:MAG: cytochrome c oxidase assembly factor Coa1 family protein [Acidobacteriota bacterium]